MAAAPHISQESDEASGDASVSSGEAIDATLRILGVLRRRWIIVAATVVLSIAVGFLVVTNLKPYWRARVTVLVNAEAPSKVLDTVRGVNDEDLWNPAAFLDYAGTQKEIIQSRKVAAAALTRLGLADDPTFLGVEDISDPAEREAAIAEIDPVERLRSMVTVGHIRESRVIWLAAEYPDATKAKEIVNAVADAYVDEVDVTRETTGERAKENLGQEKEQAVTRLRDTEQRLDAFKETHEITTISLADRQNLVTQNVMTLSAKTKDAQTERIERDALYSEAKKLHAAGSLASASLLPPSERMAFDEMLTERIQAERDLVEMKTKYLPEHPQYRKAKTRFDLIEERIEGASRDILTSLRARRDAARASEANLKAALDAEHKKALLLGRLEPEFRELEREAQAAEESYLLLSRRDAEVGITNRVETGSPVEILDYATVPVVPVRPKKTMLLAFAAFAGLAVGAAGALAVDLRDHRIRSLVDLERVLSQFGLPVLGQLPALPNDPVLGTGNVRAQRRQRDLYTILRPKSHMAERCRGIRTSLAFSAGDDGPRALLITSPASGEGKSSTAMNLALSYCQANKRTILVDADMRRPRVHQVFPPAIDRSEIGLSAVLSGRATLDEAILTDLEDVPSTLSALVCGNIPENPAELLESHSWRQLIEDLKARFDVVIVDSPPLLPVTDPLVASPQVDGVVLVARCGTTTKSAVQRGVSLLRQGDTNLLGVVLNQVDPRTEGRGYGYGYGYRKSPYYTYSATPETSAEA